VIRRLGTAPKPWKRNNILNAGAATKTSATQNGVGVFTTSQTTCCVVGCWVGWSCDYVEIGSEWYQPPLLR